MMFGTYGAGGEPMPRVIHLSVARYRGELPQPGEALTFLVSIHEEGTGITWQQNVTVDPETESFFLQATRDLHLWSVNLAHTPAKARDMVRSMGEQLYETFIGSEGQAVLDTIEPTALLLDVDETILNLPWELIALPRGPLAQEVPFGRLVTTRQHLRPGRDPLQEDAVVRILGVANPTLDLAVAEKALSSLSELAGQHGPFAVEVDTLTRKEATLVRFAELLADGDYDILHFAGHGFLDAETPGTSVLRFADGDLTANAIGDLPWKAPPYFVFGSACESGRAAGGQRLVSQERQSNGLAAAFLAAGVYGYAGYFWPVTEVGAGMFTRTFYETMFERENVGLAFLEARRRVFFELDEVMDLTAYSAILYGDAASKHRRDLAMAA